MRQALVMLSFGTTVPEARVSIEAVEKAMEAAAAGYTAVRAYTSPTVRRILAERGEKVPSLTEGLERLYGEGVSRVLVQPTHLLYGYEYDKLKAEAEKYSERFEKLVVGEPLLADKNDILRFAEEIARTCPQRQGEATVYMGHGTGHAANEVYPALQKSLNRAGRSDICIGTVEGWPGLAEVRQMLKAPCRVRLTPLMLVAGDHARKDMAVVWKKALEQAGHSVHCGFTGLGELLWVQGMYRDKLMKIL